jgi:hypothetical protein
MKPPKKRQNVTYVGSSAFAVSILGEAAAMKYARAMPMYLTTTCG